MSPRTGKGLAFAAVVLLTCAACVEHGVGPARSAGVYEGKARTTASAALSSVETVRLLAETSAGGRSFRSYTNVAISEQEDALDAISGDFNSIQPPDSASDAIRDRLGAILDAALDHVADVRIAARRGQLDELGDVAAPLEADAQALNEFLDGES